MDISFQIVDKAPSCEGALSTVCLFIVIFSFPNRYLLFSESCLLLFIVPSSCIGCKSSLMVRINNFTRFCCIFKGARFV